MSSIHPSVLTIAGSDSGGGAGIQGDIKTFEYYGIYSGSVITAVTAQDTNGVKSIEYLSDTIIGSQLKLVLEDLQPKAIKIGMLGKASIIDVVASHLKNYDNVPIVLDPVLKSTSGKDLLLPEAYQLLKDKLFPLVSLVTPNIPEMEMLTNKKICSDQDYENAALTLSKWYKGGILIKGGHNVKGANDYLWCKGQGYWYKSQRLDIENVHGTGCSLSSAIAANLAIGRTLCESISISKTYLQEAMAKSYKVGKGESVLNHKLDS